MKASLSKADSAVQVSTSTLLYSNNVYCRHDEQINGDGTYSVDNLYWSTNFIPCVGAKRIIRNLTIPSNSRTVFKLSNNSYLLKNGVIIDIPENAVSFACSIVNNEGAGYFALKEYIIVEYNSITDIDLTTCPIYGTVTINNTPLNLIDSDTNEAIESNNNYDALFAVYVGKDSVVGNSNPIVLLCGGFGKKLTKDGWLSSTSSWEDFIKDMQNVGITVICAGDWRDTTTTDTYRSDINAYVIPTLGNPSTTQIYNKALVWTKKTFNLTGNVGIIGCSQGGILGLNYQYLHGGISAIVEMSPLVNLSVHGWTQQTSNVKACYQEWYGFSGDSYQADKLKGFDPYSRIQTINNASYLNSVPIKMLCGGADTTAGTTYQQIVVNAIKNANCVAEMHILTDATHSLAGGNYQVANQEAILWIKRFC